MSKRKGKSKNQEPDLVVSESSEKRQPLRMTRQSLAARNRALSEHTADTSSVQSDSVPENIEPSNHKELVLHSSETRSNASQSIADSIKNSHLTPDEERKCREATENYISNCKYFNIPIDASVVIALQTGWKVLHPSSRFTEGSMLPLKNILEENDIIRKLNLSNVGMQDSR